MKDIHLIFVLYNIKNIFCHNIKNMFCHLERKINLHVLENAILI